MLVGFFGWWFVGVFLFAGLFCFVCLFGGCLILFIFFVSNQHRLTVFLLCLHGWGKLFSEASLNILGDQETGLDMVKIQVINKMK